MSDYYGLYGQKVQYLASDPTDVQIGQVWYNSTSATLKVRAVTTSGTYSSGGNLNTARNALGGVGSQTASLGMGGYAIPNYIANTESYNGSSWTNVNSMGTARGFFASGGTQASAFIAGGFNGGPHPTPAGFLTEEWNGTSWSPGGSLNTGRLWNCGSGTQTAGISFSGGNPTIGISTTATEEYDGTSWTSVNNMNTARITGGRASGGTQTATLGWGGTQFPAGTDLSASESYNGTSWTNTPSLNTARNFGMSGAGTQTSALAMGGSDAGGRLDATEIWNGTSWSTDSASLITTVNNMGGAGTQTAALIFGGNNPSNTSITTTQEYDGPGLAVTKTVTVS